MEYFDPQTKNLLTLIYVHPSVLFSGDYISTLGGGLRHNIFKRARDWLRLPSAHPHWHGGPPLKNFSREN